MKLTKLASIATIAAFTLGVCSAKAVIGITTNSSKLTVTLTIGTNAPTVVSGDTSKSKVKTFKAGNKQLLDLFAQWTNADRTVDPWKTAKLVVGWDASWNGDVLVVDKTGTNVLFDATVGVDAGSAFFLVDFFDEFGAANWTDVDALPGSYGGTANNSADFELFDDFVFLDYTDLNGFGGSKQAFKQTWDANNQGKTWSDKESATFPAEGDQWFLDDGTDTTLSGKIGASGKGKGYNYLGWFD